MYVKINPILVIGLFAVRLLRLFLFNIFLLITLSGCVSTIFLAGSAASTAMTAQEVDEEYDGNVVDYVVEKTSSFYDYIMGQ